MGKGKLVPILIFAVAIAIAYFVATKTYGILQQRKTVAVAVDGTKHPVTLPVAVAKTDLSWGTSIHKDMINMVPYLKESLPSGFFSDLSALEGRVLMYPAKVNEPIFESKLAPISVTEGGIAVVLKPNMRAMSVKVNKVIGISGFIQPGNRVDVLVTTKRVGKSSASLSITKTVLENILVLASGSKIDNDNGSKQKSKGVDVITLEVTPEEGEKLALASTKGQIQLALRNFADHEEVITKGSTIPTLLSSYSVPPEVTPKPEEVTGKPVVSEGFSSVTLIKGTNVNELIF